MQRFCKPSINLPKLLLWTLFVLALSGLTACTISIRPVDPADSGVGTTASLAQAPGVLNVQQLLANQLHVEPTTVQVVSVVAIEWPDICLGAATKQQMALTLREQVK